MAGGATQNVEITVGRDLSTATIQGIRVEVTPDSNVVVYTNEGVQTRPATASGEAAACGEAHPEDLSRKSGTGGTLISISEDFNTVVLNGATIGRAADGRLVISTPGIVITRPAPANDDSSEDVPRRGSAAPIASCAEPKAGLPAQSRGFALAKAGDRMPDGTVFAGISPDTGNPMYATPADAPLTMKWKRAMEYAAKLDAHGHQDWRVPTKGELNVLFNNRAAIGGFDVTGSNPAGWYCSSAENFLDAWGQRFSDGYQNWNFKSFDSSLRCVR